MMDIGRRSMMNNQTALQTTGHNIANKTTEGYSRQRVEVQTADPVTDGNLRLGMGTKAATVSRTNNPYLEKQLTNEQSTMGYQQGKADTMTRVESVYNEQINKGLNSSMSEFFNAFRELANNPESMATKTMVKESANALAENFKRAHDQLIEVTRDIDAQLKVNIGDINEFSRQLAVLNEKILAVEVTGQTANDERDQRDVILKKLGEKINIRWAEGANGAITVTAGSSGILVAGNDAKVLQAQPSARTDSRLEGAIDIYHRNGETYTPVNITTELKGGTVGGLLEVRDKIVTGLLDDMDKMAYTLGSTVNAIHARGYDSQGKPAGEFFDLGETDVGACGRIKVADEIMENPNRIASGAQPRAPGDNRIANAIAQVQYTGLISDGTTTVDEFYNSIVGKVGSQARAATIAMDSQKDIVKQMQAIRDSISGVSMDEETTKLIEYQKAFDASARLIKTADEMLDTVINLKR
jgi:flagellar hook-associated protein 1 FlgK